MVIRRSGPGGEIPSCGGFRGKEHFFCFLFMLPTLPPCLTETGSTLLTWFFGNFTSSDLVSFLSCLFVVVDFFVTTLRHFTRGPGVHGWKRKILEEFQEIFV